MVDVPAVSVIIPLYNAEKYVAECLDSFWSQTFQDFEIIVVDDCSTDNSLAIVKSYLEKFGGRLKISRMKKNSGSAPAPRNKGFNFSRGEYVFFIDPDDLLTPTALEEFYTLAKRYDADVVYTEKYYAKNSDSPEIRESHWQKGGFVDKPTLEPYNLAERVQGIVQERYSLEPWNNLIKRNFIVENKISFPALKVYDDELWTYAAVLHAKKYLRVPRPLCIHRFHESSNTGATRKPLEHVKFFLGPVILGTKILDDIMSKIEFFQTNPQYRYAVLVKFICGKFDIIFPQSFQFQPFVVYETIKQEFGGKLGEHDVLISALCTLLNNQQKISFVNQKNFEQSIAQAQSQIKNLEAQLSDSRRRIAELGGGLN